MTTQEEVLNTIAVLNGTLDAITRSGKVEYQKEVIDKILELLKLL